MAVMLKYVLYTLLIDIAVGQYGPLPGKTRHRTTTTTQTPDAANEVLPPSPYQPPPGYKPPAPPGQQPPSPYPSPSQGQPTPQQPSPQYPPSSAEPTSQYPTSGSGPTSSSQPQFPSPSGQPSTQYPTPGQPTSQYPTPSGQPQYPSPSGQPSTQQPSSSGQPTSQYPTTGGSGQPSPQYPYPSVQPSSQQPTPSGQPQYPTPSGQPQYPTPSGQPQYSPPSSGKPSPQNPTPSGQPQYPTPSGQPQYPTPSGQPTPQYPTSGGSSKPSPQYPTPSGQPQYPISSVQPSPQPPTQSGQPTNQYPQPGQPSSQYPTQPGQPSPQYPSQPQFPTSSGQPSQKFPQTFPGQPSQQFPGPSSSPSKPQYPAPPGNLPVGNPPKQQFWWANPQSPFKPGVRPTSVAPPPPNQGFGPKPSGSQCPPNIANNPFIGGNLGKPQQPGFGPQNKPGFPPQPQNPLPSPSRPQPGYGQPASPSQQYSPKPSGSGTFPSPQVGPIPSRPNQNVINPNNPFLNNGLQNPVGQQPGGTACNAEAAYCVPSYQCNNGIVTNSASLLSNLKKGPCASGEVCCKVKKPSDASPSYPTQPQPTYSNQPKPYAVTESPKYTGPLNTTPYPGCPAALKCVDISYCTAEGVMSDTPVALTREQIENRVPLTECQDMNTGAIGKCCRDPNYKDPWPAGMMMPAGPKNFDDGLYHPPTEQQFDDGQYHPSPEQGEPEYTTISPPNPHTIKLPLGVFKQKVTPFPIAPRPGQTHEQVFPGNEDKLYGTPAPLTPHHVAPQPQQPGYLQPQQPLYQPQPQPSQSAYYPQPSQPGQPQYPVSPSQSTYISTTLGQLPYQPTSPQQFLPPQPQPSQQSTYQPQPQQPTPSQQKPTQSKPSSQSPHQSSYSQPSSQTPSQQPTQPIPGKECGVRRPTQGAQPDESGFGEFPWHATIASKGNNSALCSAAIIAPNAVITSAHCIEGLNPEEMQIKAGVYTLGQEGPKAAQIREVGAAAIHPSYDSGSLAKDQAIVVTEEPLVLDEHIDKVCLAPTTQEEYEPSGGDCFVTGFGRPSLQKNTPGTRLHKIKVNLIPKEQCENNLKKTHLGKYFILNKGFTCAAPLKEADLCKVDVGSPLVCQKPDGRYELAGVYSWDTKCSTALPGVMASCDNEWIQQVLATPIEKLREQYARPQIATHLVIDIDTKPGFALGYGK